ncbi:hypothetical protein F444_03521 [Phytophthora nicotianae P1976]|uniref:Necrosis inducing protein NPP1 type n=1 Tax=Phytophthora nicotianae P1976 TaxID=1317066 RepID=A0A081ATV8_PHYNI|nr:hypothetical protein F444_03521 [Phytophthora nicotianae P1976]
MNLQIIIATLFATVVTCGTATVDHGKIEPFPQPEPVTISENAAIKFKPQLFVSASVCASFLAVNAAGETTDGLKGSNRNDACKYALLGSQVYGRARWYKDLWPSCFWTGFVSRRHDWKSIVVWIDNPALETPKIIAVSMSTSDTTYNHPMASDYIGTNTSFRVRYQLGLGSPNMTFTHLDGEYQPLIMWEQLTDAARVALNESFKFEDAEMPFNDEYFEKRLEKARPL